MRVGITRSASSIWYGGIFHYESIFLDALSQIARTCSEELAFLSWHPDDIVALAYTGDLNYRGLAIKPLYSAPPTPKQESPEFYIRLKPAEAPPPVDPLDVKFDARVEALFRNAGVDLLLLTSPFFHAFQCRMPFVMPIFDLNHKLQPEFVEVSALGETNSRDYMFVNACRFATLILVDSEVGKADVLRFYGDFIDEDRIRVFPYYPPIVRKAMPELADLSRVRSKYGLPDRYFFYPAQFWSHKNHALVLRAIRLIADESGEVVPVVFCGSYADYNRAQNFKEMDVLAKELNIADHVRYLGVIPDEDMASLYTMSVGLVMPTFFGPTNIPPLEAWHYGRPVITSDIRGLREQIGDAGLLVDPRSPQDLARAMLELWRDKGLGAVLAERGRRHLSSYSWDTFVERVEALVLEACERARTGKTPAYP